VRGRFEPEFTAAEPVNSRATEEQTAGAIHNRIMQNMGVGKTASLTELHKLCNSAAKPHDVDLLDAALRRCVRGGRCASAGVDGPDEGQRVLPRDAMYHAGTGKSWCSQRSGRRY